MSGAASSVVVGRRHHLALLFADLSDSTRIASAMEPERYARLIQTLRDSLDIAVARHGGEIARIDGDGALCIFGWPDGQEDAARRATDTAIDLHVAAAALSARAPVPLRMHSGIHAGLVLLRAGDMARGRFEMLGDATNVAARLSDAAGPGEILVSAATLGSDRHFFRTGQTRHLAVAGRAADIAVIPVLGRHKADTRLEARSRSGLTRFTGRERELARLWDWLGDWRADWLGDRLGDRPGGAAPASIAILVGPPGIGKTRLIGEFLADATARGVAVHRGYCESYLGARPLQPFEQLAASITAAADRAKRLEPTPPSEAADPIAHLHRLIERAASDHACIFAIDDWQWADDASRRLLAEVAAAGGPHARFLLASREPNARIEPSRPITLIDVPPLPASESLAAIATLLAMPDPFLSARINEQAGGNPLFIEELCHATGRRRARAATVTASAWLDMLIQARFAHLKPEQAALVRAAAVIGHIQPAWLFATVSGIALDDPRVTGLADTDFLFPGEVAGTLRFKHGITRDAVYQVIALDEREALHRRVVAALDDEAAAAGTPPNFDALAYHCAAGGDLARAVPMAIAAGDAALVAGALDRARAHFAGAFDHLTAQRIDEANPALLWRLVNKYGLACIADPSPDHLPLLAAMADRLEQHGHAEAHVRSRYWLGAIAYGLGDGRRSIAHLEAALLRADRLALDRLSLQIEVKLAQSLFAAGHYTRADTMFERVLPRVRDGSGRNDRATLGYALSCHGFLLADRGDFDAAERRYDEAEALLASAAPSLLASCLTQRSAARMMQGRWRDAAALAQRCLVVCGSHHAPYQAMMAQSLAAYAAWRADRDPASPGILSGAARWFAEDASHQRTSLLHGWLAEVMAERGEPATAYRHALQAVLRVRTGGDRLGEGMAYRAMARIAADGGARHAPARYLAAARRSAVLRGSSREMALADLCEGSLLLTGGDHGPATALADRAASAFADMGASVFVDEARALITATRQSAR